METRKIQWTGGSTFTVSLPKAWVVGSGLRAGDLIGITPQGDGTLTLSPDPSARHAPVKKTLTVEREMSPEHFLRLLIGHYVAGYDALEIRARGRIEPDVRRTIRDYARRVIGPEIVEESLSAATLQDVSDASDLPITKVVRRMHLMARAMHEDAVTALRSNDLALAHDITARDDDVDRLYWFAAKQRNLVLRDRALAARLGLSDEEAVAQLAVAKALERIADHAGRIAEAVALLKGERVEAALYDQIAALSRGAIAMLDQSIEALATRNAELANRNIDALKKVAEQQAEILERALEKRGKVAVALTRIVDSLERTASYAADISEVAINLEAAMRPEPRSSP